MAEGGHEAIVTAAALVCSLGCDLETACAAARAGLVRSSGFDAFPLHSPAAEGPELLVCHSLPVGTEGFEGDARLQGLLLALLRDLQGRVALPAGTPAVLVLPARTETESSEAEVEPGESPVARGRRLFARASRALGSELGIELRDVQVGSGAALVRVLGQAIEALGSGAAEQYVILALDSLLQVPRLELLWKERRLKTPDVPSGLQPGEAGVALVLGAGSSSNGEPPLGHVRVSQLVEESASFDSEDPPTGRALTRVLREVCGEPHADEAQLWILSDHNGEEYRAQELGCAMSRLTGELGTEPDFEIWAPAAAIGDVGAASAGVGLCFALEAFRRCYAPSSRALVVVGEDAGARAAVHVRAPESR